MTLSLQKATGKNAILLPLGRGDDGAHSQNEKFDVSNYIEGVSVTCFRVIVRTTKLRLYDLYLI